MLGFSKGLMSIFASDWCARTGRGRGQQVVTLLLRAATLVLVLFHARLLLAHLAGGQILEPAEATRWIAGALILSAFMALRRRGIPVLHGRRALVLWLLVGMLHVSASQPPGAAFREVLGLPAALATVSLPAGLAPLLTGLSLVLLAALRRRQSAVSAASVALRMAPGTPATRAGSPLQISSRPPPL